MSPDVTREGDTKVGKERRMDGIIVLVRSSHLVLMIVSFPPLAHYLFISYRGVLLVLLRAKFPGIGIRLQVDGLSETSGSRRVGWIMFRALCRV
jgi:hypothetical protein